MIGLIIGWLVAATFFIILGYLTWIAVTSAPHYCGPDCERHHGG
jgi:hypothetical protein